MNSNRRPLMLPGAQQAPRARSCANSRAWRRVTRRAPCPACGKMDWCAWSPDGSLLKCERTKDAPPGFERVNVRDGGALFRPTGSGRGHNGDHNTVARASAPRGVKHNRRTEARCGDARTRRPGGPRDWSAEAERFAATITLDRIAELASILGVRSEALVVLRVGWATTEALRAMRASGADWQNDYPLGAFVFPERDGSGRIIGLSMRAVDGRKGSPSSVVGARRGLTIPSTLKDRPDPVLLVEGASDVAACETLGLAAVGRPSNAAGADQLAALLRGRSVLVLGEHDAKEGGAWPGRDGAERVAVRLATEWCKTVLWALPPGGAKDIRAWVQTRISAGLDLTDAQACEAAGAELLQVLQASAEEAEPEKRLPQSELLVRLALERYRIGLARGDEPFAVARDGPNVALMFRGARDALRSALSKEYRARYGTTPNGSALADAMTALQGEAYDRAPETVHLRLAEHTDQIILDLGGADGRVVIVGQGGWDIVDTSPVLFRRTALTAELSEPRRGGSLELLRGLLNVTDECWPLVLGWLVAAFIPNIPHPILLLGGEQGTGKSSAARLLVGLFDPSTATLRSPPSEPEQWVLAAAGSWGVCLDNVSFISPWWSDALCKAVTGDGWVRRRLYSDGDLSVVSFRRVVLMTSIDVGALRGDLADRLVIADLEPIREDKRRAETDLDGVTRERQPLILGALLHVVADVLARLPQMKLPVLPRMADFGSVLAAVDEVLGLKVLPLYLAQHGRIANDVIEADPFGAAVLSFAEVAGTWSGSATQLLARIKPPDPEKLPPGWPKATNALSCKLKRLAAPLRAVGVDVKFARSTTRDRSKTITIQRVAVPTVQIVRSSADAGFGQAAADPRRTVADDDGRSETSHRPEEACPSGTPGVIVDGADDPDDQMLFLSSARQEEKV